MNIFAKRIMTSVILGVGAGIVCAWGATTQGVVGALDIGHPMFWLTVSNRAVLGFFVGVIGVVSIHPVFNSIRMRYMRGIAVGVFVSVTMALGALIEGTWSTFFMILGAGAVIGLGIDALVTKMFGDGAHLLDYEM